MSSSYNPKDGRWYIPSNEPLREDEKAILEFLFDTQIDEDVYSAEKIIKEKKLLWRICLIKTLVFLPELILTFLLLENKAVLDKIACQSVYWQYLRKKLTLEEFSTKMNSTLRSMT